MPRIDIPEGDDKITDRVWQLRPEYAEPARLMLEACGRHSILDRRLREAVRYRIAIINGCLLCQQARSEETGMTEAAYADVATFRTSPWFSDREKLALEYAELFALDHHSIDDEFFDRMRAEFTDPEIVDLTFFTGRFMAFGRLTHVLGLDDTCELVPPVAAGAGAGIASF
jgi:alkylhydroperoxidase family enzyme